MQVLLCKKKLSEETSVHVVTAMWTQVFFQGFLSHPWPHSNFEEMKYWMHLFVLFSDSSWVSGWFAPREKSGQKAGKGENVFFYPIGEPSFYSKKFSPIFSTKYFLNFFLRFFSRSLQFEQAQRQKKGMIQAIIPVLPLFILRECEVILRQVIIYWFSQKRRKSENYWKIRGEANQNLRGLLRIG